jgi:hypothetical protein
VWINLPNYSDQAKAGNFTSIGNRTVKPGQREMLIPMPGAVAQFGPTMRRRPELIVGVGQLRLGGDGSALRPNFGINPLPGQWPQQLWR